MKKLTMILSALMLVAGTLLPQVNVTVTVANQEVVGTEFFFDLYLRTNSASEILYLGNSDFVFTYDVGNFNSPTINLVGDPFDGGGYCTFVPTNATASNITGTREQYAQSTSDTIYIGETNKLYINLLGTGITGQTQFNNRVARIDNSPLTHRLGRFSVTGITNPNGFMDLQWVTGSIIVRTIDTSNPWNESPTIVHLDPISNAPLPVELTSFTATYKNSAVTLNWQTKTEVNNYGFNVERRINEGEWDSIKFIEGSGNSNSPKEYSYTDKELFAGGSKFQYRLKQIDSDGSFEYSDVVEVEVVPDQFELSQNYPNPFNPSTTIRFSLPQAAQIKINLYNMLGEQVANIAEGMYESGFHKVTFNAIGLPSGTYVYRLESSEFVQVKKMVLIK
ncbi:MAG: T9SS type A sorting domain-containing protein [Ignavibacteriaceae bacterium]|nr:T9SS type A sorting domain-containing protein [Ignavibacteriaceae bacterium]